MRTRAPRRVGGAFAPSPVACAVCGVWSLTGLGRLECRTLTHVPHHHHLHVPCCAVWVVPCGVGGAVRCGHAQARLGSEAFLTRRHGMVVARALAARVTPDVPLEFPGESLTDVDLEEAPAVAAATDSGSDSSGADGAAPGDPPHAALASSGATAPPLSSAHASLGPRAATADAPGPSPGLVPFALPVESDESSADEDDPLPTRGPPRRRRVAAAAAAAGGAAAGASALLPSVASSVPVHVRAAVAAAASQEDYVAAQAALPALAGVIRACAAPGSRTGHTLLHALPFVVRTLLALGDRFSTPGFEHHRTQALVACAVAAPEPACALLFEHFFAREESDGVRHDILAVLVAAGRELAGLVERQGSSGHSSGTSPPALPAPGNQGAATMVVVATATATATATVTVTATATTTATTTVTTTATTTAMVVATAESVDVGAAGTSAEVGTTAGHAVAAEGGVVARPRLRPPPKTRRWGTVRPPGAPPAPNRFAVVGGALFWPLLTGLERCGWASSSSSSSSSSGRGGGRAGPEVQLLQVLGEVSGGGPGAGPHAPLGPSGLFDPFRGAANGLLVADSLRCLAVLLECGYLCTDRGPMALRLLDVAWWLRFSDNPGGWAPRSLPPFLRPPAWSRAHPCFCAAPEHVCLRVPLLCAWCGRSEVRRWGQGPGARGLLRSLWLRADRLLVCACGRVHSVLCECAHVRMCAFCACVHVCMRRFTVFFCFRNSARRCAVPGHGAQCCRAAALGRDIAVHDPRGGAAMAAGGGLVTY
jgi:hypothetical protein